MRSAAPGTSAAQEYRVPAEAATLYARTAGSGPAAIVLHGGPDFDHAYFLPDLDRLGDQLRLVYYDQRGRGLSAEGYRPEDVTLESDVEDVDRVRRYLSLEMPIVIGHSWGTVLALEYALRHPDRVSALILMNPAPASASDVPVTRAYYLSRIGAEMERQREIVRGAAYQQGDPAAVTARYRIHFRPAFARAEPYERLMTAMQRAFTRQGAQGILEARAVEDRLMADSWDNAAYDLYPRIASLRIPTLVLYGDQDFIPAGIAEQLARAIPHAQLVTIRDCGHFSYMECPADVQRAIRAFLSR